MRESFLLRLAAAVGVRVRGAPNGLQVRLFALRTGYHHTRERVCPEFATENLENHRKVYEFAAQFAPKVQVLDVGCGTGYGAAFLAGAGAASVTGIDNSEEAIRYARKKFHMNGLSFRSMDAEYLQLPGGAFDLVVSSENLEHVNDPHESISEIRRVLRSGGIFLLGTPNKEMFSPGRDRPVNRYHVKEFYFEELRDLLAEFFTTVLVIENTLESKHELGRELYADRLRRGAIGLRVGEMTELEFAGRTVSLRHLHNTHSFIALAE